MKTSRGLLKCILLAIAGAVLISLIGLAGYIFVSARVDPTWIDQVIWHAVKLIARPSAMLQMAILQNRDFISCTATVRLGECCAVVPPPIREEAGTFLLWCFTAWTLILSPLVCVISMIKRKLRPS